MANILDYIAFRKDILFRNEPFNEVDALAFSVISYLDFSDVLKDEKGAQKIRLGQLAWEYRKKKQSHNTHYEPTDKEKCLYEMASGERYSKVSVVRQMRQISEDDCMTSYVTIFERSPFQAIVAYPGTSSALISWKENFVFMYDYHTKGQKLAMSYLKDYLEGANFLQKLFQKVCVIGHSKGGLLAVYAAMNQSEKLRKRVKKLYTFDAPNFVQDISREEGYMDIKSRMEPFVPVDSVVGRVFHNQYPKPKVVVSAAERYGQHDMLTWQVGPTTFSYANQNSEWSDKTVQMFNELLESVPLAERSLVVDEMFDIFLSNGIEDVADVSGGINFKTFKEGFKILTKYPHLSQKTKGVLKTIVKEAMTFNKE